MEARGRMKSTPAVAKCEKRARAKTGDHSESEGTPRTRNRNGGRRAAGGRSQTGPRRSGEAAWPKTGKSAM